jgi:LemA protein
MGPETLFPLIVVGVIILVPLAYVLGTYNRLVRLRNTIRESWSNVDTELKRRYDLIPNLVNTVKGYAAHERAVFEAVVRARAAAMASTGSPAEQARDENELIRQMRSLFAVVERYPDLKASQNFLQLQHELVNTEDRIQAARRFYNGNVRENNVLVQSVPSNIVAGMFGFTTAEFFEIEDLSMRGAVAVSFT